MAPKPASDPHIESATSSSSATYSLILRSSAAVPVDEKRSAKEFMVEGSREGGDDAARRVPKTRVRTCPAPAMWRLLITGHPPLQHRDVLGAYSSNEPYTNCEDYARMSWQQARAYVICQNVILRMTYKLMNGCREGY